jgi:lipopolysaccharide export system protein LptA
MLFASCRGLFANSPKSRMTADKGDYVLILDRFSLNGKAALVSGGASLYGGQIPVDGGYAAK